MRRPTPSARIFNRVCAALLGVSCLALFGPSATSPPALESAEAGVVPSGFVETTAFSGLTNPMVVRFSPDGRVFVGEKSGLIKVFASTSATTPTVFADLRTNVHNFWDRGLLGMTLHPNFPTVPYVYVSYTYDHILGDPAPAPKWGTPGATSDSCPTPPGPLTSGCVVSGRVSRMQATGNVCRPRAGARRGLVPAVPEPLGRRGRVRPRRDALRDRWRGRELLASPTTGRSAAAVRRPGRWLAPPGAEGGALRSQDLRTTADPGRAERLAHPRQPEHGRRARRATRWPVAPTSTRDGFSRTGCGTPSGSRSGRARARSGSAMSAGTTGRRSTRSTTRPAAS